MERQRYLLFLTTILAGVLLLSVACSQPEPTPAPPTPSPAGEAGTGEVSPETTEPAAPAATPVDESGYPAADAESGYPPAGDEEAAEAAYPPPRAEEAIGGPKGPNFSLDRPLQAGATTVSGQAPGELNLAIVDVTFAGEILGTGRSGADGSFSISVSPLREGHTVGVTISSLEGDQTMEEFAVEYYPYRGEGYTNVPNIGVFFDTAVVQP